MSLGREFAEVFRQRLDDEIVVTASGPLPRAPIQGVGLAPAPPRAQLPPISPESQPVPVAAWERESATEDGYAPRQHSPASVQRPRTPQQAARRSRRSP